jgi:hypothetical protein
MMAVTMIERMQVVHHIWMKTSWKWTHGVKKTVGILTTTALLGNMTVLLSLNVIKMPQCLP